MPSGSKADAVGAGTSMPVPITVYIGGRRQCRVKVLEEKAAGLKQQIRLLRKKNAALREQEDVQMHLLANYQDTLHHTGNLVGQLPAEDIMVSPMVTAAMMDLQAAELLQHVRGDAQKASDGQEARCGSDQPGAESQGMSRSQHLWASVTPQALLELKGISPVALAEKIKLHHMRIALVRECNKGCGAMPPPNIKTALDGLIVLVLMALVVADQQWLQVTCMNLETMQQDEPPADLWPRVLSRLNLSVQQRRQACLAYVRFKDHRSALVKKQNHILQQLHTALWHRAGSSQQQQQPADVHASEGQNATARVCACKEGDSASPDSSAGTAVPPSTCVANASCATATASGADALTVASQPATQQANSSGTHSSLDCTGSRSNKDKEGLSSPALGLLYLEDVMHAEQLCQALDRNTQLQRSNLRMLLLFYIDLLTTEQHVEAILCCYPYGPKPPALCECVWEQESQQQTANAAD